MPAGAPLHNPHLDRAEQTHPRPRPRFDLVLAAQPLEVLARIRAAVAATDQLNAVLLEDGGSPQGAPEAARVHKVELTLRGERVRFWSPQLACLLSAHPAGGTLVKARFGPHPHVWGMYLAGYATSALLTIGLLVFGLVQLWLGHTPWALWCTPLALLITGLTFGAAFVGQGLGAGQMHALRAFLERALEEGA